MKELIHKVTINAPVEKVYSIMLDPIGFSQWTKIFSPGSVYRGEWSEGSIITFYESEENIDSAGLICRIIENIIYSKVSMEYFGLIHESETYYNGDMVDRLLGYGERYVFHKKEDATLVEVQTDALDEWIEFFEKKYPIALRELKEICEQ